MRSLRSPTCFPDDDHLLVRRSDLEGALDGVTIAYENAVAAADEGLLDFGPVDELPEAIRILRGALTEGAAQ